SRCRLSLPPIRPQPCQSKFRSPPLGKANCRLSRNPNPSPSPAPGCHHRRHQTAVKAILRD
ncbi:MAG: hypothetical protein ACK5SM_01615, partial [Sphingomonadales bacterium]